MPTIRGLKIEAGKEIPQVLKDIIKRNGVKLPFDASEFKYTNRELDNWLRIKKDKDIYRFDRNSMTWVKEIRKIEQEYLTNDFI